MAENKFAGVHSLVYKESGHLLLIPYNADNTLDYSRAYDSRRGIVQSIARTFSKTTVDLTDGNSPYPAHTYTTTQQGTITIGLGTTDPELEALLAGASYKEGEAKDTWLQRSFILGADHKVTIPEGVKPKDAKNSLILEDVYGVKLKPGTSAEELTDGQYFYAGETGELTFHEGYANQTIRASYIYSAATSVDVSYAEAPRIPTFQAIIIGPAISYDETTSFDSVITFDRCSVTGDISAPERTNDPTGGYSIELTVAKPREGHAPVDIAFVPPAEATFAAILRAGKEPVASVPGAASKKR